ATLQAGTQTVTNANPARIFTQLNSSFEPFWGPIQGLRWIAPAIQVVAFSIWVTAMDGTCLCSITLALKYSGSRFMKTLVVRRGHGCAPSAWKPFCLWERTHRFRFQTISLITLSHVTR